MATLRPGESGFSVIGVAGKKVFVVKSIPGGTAQVQYTIEGQRSHLTGPLCEMLTVSFGWVDVSKADTARTDRAVVEAIVKSKPMAGMMRTAMQT